MDMRVPLLRVLPDDDKLQALKGSTLPTLLPTPEDSSRSTTVSGSSEEAPGDVTAKVEKSAKMLRFLPAPVASDRSLRSAGVSPMVGNPSKISKSMGRDLRGPMGRLKDDLEDGSMRMERRYVLDEKRQTRSFTGGMDMEYYDKFWSPETDNHDEMPLSGLIVNMSADLIPAGFLPLSGCMASSGVGWLPAAFLVILFYGLSSYTLTLLAKTANTLDVSEPSLELTFKGIWQIVIGKASWFPPLAVLCVCFGNCIAYSCFFADLLVTGLPGLGAPVWLQSRTLVLLSISAFPLLPLCMLRDLSSLAPSSAAGIAMVVYTVGFMAWRAYDGSYQVGGQFHNTSSEPLTPDFSVASVFRLGSAPLLLINALALAYLAHYNGMKYYRELQNHTVQRFKVGVRAAMGAAAAIYIVTMWLGYYTFGDNAMGVILSNYDASRDVLATISRLGMGFSIVASYPLMFAGLREAAVATLQELLPEKENLFKTIKFLNFVTFVILFAITAIAAIVSDASLVVGIVGSLLGSTIIYVLPATLFIQAHKKSEKFKWRVLIAKVLLAFGAFLGIFGCYTVLAN